MKSFALALDIDGVFLRGKRVLDFAIRTVDRIKKENTPFIFITNGGGISEEQKAREMSEKLQTEILPSQILLSHTPFKKYAKKYAEKRVLVLGREPECVEVAKMYGFKRAVSVRSIHGEFEDIYPMRKPERLSEMSGPVEAAFVFHDPMDWALEVQSAN